MLECQLRLVAVDRSWIYAACEVSLLSDAAVGRVSQGKETHAHKMLLPTTLPDMAGAIAETRTQGCIKSLRRRKPAEVKVKVMVYQPRPLAVTSLMSETA